MTKKTIFIIFIFITQHFYAQDNIDLKKIFRSGEYYYTKIYDVDLNTAKNKAKNSLLSLISSKIAEKEDIKNTPEFIVNNIQFYTKQLRGQYKVVAYVKKKDITAEKKLKTLDIAEVREAKKIGVKKNIINKNNPKIYHKEKANEQTNKQITIKRNSSLQNKTNLKNNKSYSQLILELSKYDDGRQLYKKIKKYYLEGKLIYVQNPRYFEKKSKKDFFKIVFNGNTLEVISFIDLNNGANIKTSKQNFNNNKYLKLWIKELK